MKYFAETHTAERKRKFKRKRPQIFGQSSQVRIELPLEFETQRSSVRRSTWTEIENENSETGDLKYLDRQQEKETEREREREKNTVETGLEGERAIFDDIHEEKCAPCIKVSEIVLHFTRSRITPVQPIEST